MSYFNISDEFKNFLGFDNKEISFFHFKNSPNINSDLIGPILIENTYFMIFDSIKNHLDVKFKDSTFENTSYNFQILLPIFESIKNAYDHGSALENVLNMEIYLGTKSLGFGICDGGNFYKNPSVKQLIKEKHLPSIDEFPSLYRFESEKRNKSKGRHGFERFYSHSDFLDVDLSEGVLFIGFTYENIVKKK